MYIIGWCCAIKEMGNTNIEKLVLLNCWTSREPGVSYLFFDVKRLIDCNRGHLKQA